MRWVVDARVAMKWFLPEADSVAAETLLDDHEDLVAPDFLLVECANIIWKKVRLGELDHSDGLAILASLRAGSPELIATRPLIELALQLAHEIDHPLHDCLYLAAAETVDATVITADRRFLDRVRRTPLARRIRLLEELA